MPTELTDPTVAPPDATVTLYRFVSLPGETATDPTAGLPHVDALNPVDARHATSHESTRQPRRRDLRQAAREESRSKRLRLVGRRCFVVAPTCLLIALLMADTYSRNAHHAHSGQCHWVCQIAHLLDWLCERVFHQTGTLVAVLVIVAVSWWAIGLARDPWHWFRVFTPTAWLTGAMLATAALWPYQPGVLSGTIDFLGIVVGQAPEYARKGTTPPGTTTITPVGDGFLLSRVLLVLAPSVAILGTVGIGLRVLLHRTLQMRARSIDIVIGNTPGTGELVRQLASGSLTRQESLYGPGAHQLRWRKASFRRIPHRHPLIAQLPDIFSWRPPRTLIFHVHEPDNPPPSVHPWVIHISLSELHDSGLSTLLASPAAARVIPGTGVCRLRHLYIFGSEQRVNLNILAEAKIALADLARRKGSGRLGSAHHGVPQLTVRLDNAADASTFWLHEINQPYSPPRSAHTARCDTTSPDAVPGEDHIGANWMVDAASTDKAVAQAIVRQLAPGQHPALIPGQDIHRLVIVGDSPLTYALLDELLWQRLRSAKLLKLLVENHENIKEFGFITAQHPRVAAWMKVMQWLHTNGASPEPDPACNTTFGPTHPYGTVTCRTSPAAIYQVLTTHAPPECGVWLAPPPVAHVKLVGPYAKHTQTTWRQRELAHLYAAVEVPLSVCECHSDDSESCLRADLETTTSPTLVVMAGEDSAASRMASRLAAANPTHVTVLEPDSNTRGVHPRLVPGGVGRFGPSWVVDGAPFASSWERLAQQVHEHDLLSGHTSATMFCEPRPSAARVTDRPWPSPYLPEGVDVLPPFFVADTIRCIHHVLHRATKGPVRSTVLREYLASGFQQDGARAHRLNTVLWQLAREEHADWLRARVQQGWVPQATNRYLRQLHAERGTEPTFDGYTNHRCDRTKINKWVRDWDEIVASPFGPQFTERTMRYAASLLTVARDTGVLSRALGHTNPAQGYVAGRHSECGATGPVQQPSGRGR